jgi:zinc transport system permease protein
VERLDLEYLLVFALKVALGLRYLGALLVGSVVIIPPAPTRRLAGGLHGMGVISALVAVTAMLTGMFVAPAMGQKTGPAIVVAAAGLFVLNLEQRWWFHRRFKTLGA